MLASLSQFSQRKENERQQASQQNQQKLNFLILFCQNLGEVILNYYKFVLKQDLRFLGGEFFEQAVRVGVEYMVRLSEVDHKEIVKIASEFLLLF